VPDPKKTESDVSRVTSPPISETKVREGAVSRLRAKREESRKTGRYGRRGRWHVVVVEGYYDVAKLREDGCPKCGGDVRDRAGREGQEHARNICPDRIRS
jgi:hypothetical protein